MAYVVQHMESVQYDGTNGAAIVASLNGSATLVNDDGATLTLSSSGDEHSVSAGGYVITHNATKIFYAVAEAAIYADVYVELPGI